MPPAPSDVTIRAMREDDLAAADRVYRLAFGTWFKLADPLSFRGDAALIAPRHWMYPRGAFVAEAAGEVIGLGMTNDWGGLGVLGPVAVHPAYWGKGVARLLLRPAIDALASWRSRTMGLFTFPQSGTHLRLYQHSGFWPRHLTPVMAKPVGAVAPVPEAVLLARASSERGALIAQCRALTDAIYDGLDLGREIESVLHNGLGDVVLLARDSRIAGFAVCHTGKGSEGGSKECYLKFAAVQSGSAAPQTLARLVAACESFARERGAGQIVAGVSAGRNGAYRLLLDLGFRTQLTGVAMHRPFQEAYDRPEIFALDDWR